MSNKKTFKKGFSGLLGEETKNQEEIQNNHLKNEKKIISQNEIGSKEKRATFIVNIEHLESIKSIAFWERKTLKNVIHEALEKYISDYNKNNGEVETPKK